MFLIPTRKFILVLGALLILIHLDAPPSACGAGDPLSAAPQAAVYRGPSPSAPNFIDAYATWLGVPGIWGEDFQARESWDNVANPMWQLRPWGKWVQARPGRRLILSVSLLPGGWDLSGPKQGMIDVGKPVSLERGAAGDYNKHFKMLAENLVKTGLGESILRLGWEFNGGWYAWRAKGKEAAFAEYWRQIVRTMRAVPGAEKLQFCFNPAQGYQQFPAEKAWPGDEFVDYVAADLYDDSWMADTYPWPKDATSAQIEARQKKVWNELLLNGDHGLIFWKKFAAAHHKPLALPEWGVDNRPGGHGGMDNPYFIEQMHRFITDPANNVAFQCYFDVKAGDGDHLLAPGLKGLKTEFPRSAERFKALFGK